MDTKKDVRRKEIVTKAVEELLNSTVRSFRMERFLKKIGMGKSSFYYYFESTEDLLRESGIVILNKLSSSLSVVDTIGYGHSAALLAVTLRDIEAYVGILLDRGGYDNALYGSGDDTLVVFLQQQDELREKQLGLSY